MKSSDANTPGKPDASPESGMPGKPEAPVFLTRIRGWIDRMDRNDQQMDASLRKKKWGAILSAFFLLYVLSFLVFPKPRLTHETLPPAGAIEGPTGNLPSATRSLPPEIPADTLFNHLNPPKHESLPETK